MGTRFPLKVRSVFADKAQLELAIMNLVVNARDAMPAGGNIILSAKEAEVPEGEESFICLSVEDLGEVVAGNKRPCCRAGPALDEERVTNFGRWSSVCTGAEAMPSTVWSWGADPQVSLPAFIWPAFTVRR
jgi:hypothetical protein|tara:strand:+ start:16750 stop:17142 length:393 start_codon:yes stop_codon:yes gene_type:complete